MKDEKIDSKKTPTALITGASSGIGQELARVMARHGHNLVLTARNEERLNELAGELREQGCRVDVLAADLSRRESADFIFEQLRQSGTHIDILVNNAGFATFGLFRDTDLESELDLIEVNIAALTHLTKLFLPGMLNRREGKILNVASTASFQPGPLMAVYFASKAYVLSFSEALANELADTGVQVTALCPGPTESGFQERAHMQSSPVVQGFMMSARTVAEIGYAGLAEGKMIVIPGRKARWFASLVRFLPRSTAAAMVRRAQTPKA